MIKKLVIFLIAGALLCLPAYAAEEDSDVSGDMGSSSAVVESSPGDTPAAVSDPEVSPEEVPSSGSDPESDTGNSSGSGSGSSGGGSVTYVIEDTGPQEVIVVDSTTEEPLPVTILEEDPVYASVYASTYGVELDILDVPPSDPPFYGSCYITGITDSGDTITLYFPVNYREGYFGVDSNGYLFNISSSSVSGYYGGVYNNSVSVSGFAYPRYRTASGYDYEYLYLTPTASNMKISTEFEGQVPIEDLLPYVIILLLGGVFVCFMKRS